MKKPLILLLLLCSLLVKLSAQTVPTLAADIVTGSVGSGLFPGFNTLGTDLYLHASTTTAAGGTGLFKYNGTATNIASSLFVSISPQSYIGIANGKVYFSADCFVYDSSTSSYGTSGYFLWYYTPGGSVAVLDSASTMNDNCRNVTFSGKMYFFGSLSSVSASPTEGLFYIDAANTVHLACDFSTLPSILTQPVNWCDQLTLLNGKLYFVASTSFNTELCVYDPATGVSSMINYFSLTSDIGDIRNLLAGDDNYLYFSATTVADGRELYVYKGTGSPVKLTALNSTSDGVEDYPGLTGNEGRNIEKMGGYIYFGGCDGLHGYDLMSLKLSDNSTSLIDDINPSAASSYPEEFVVYNGKVYFSADDGTHGRELWVTDGTTANMVADTYPGSSDSDPYDMTPCNGKLYFWANNGITGEELYYIGTAGSSVASVNMVNDINTYPNPASDAFNIKIDLKIAAGLSGKVCDVSGKEVYTLCQNDYPAGVSVITIPMKEYPVGVYLYSVYTSNGELIAAGRISHNE